MKISKEDIKKYGTKKEIKKLIEWREVLDPSDADDADHKIPIGDEQDSKSDNIEIPMTNEQVLPADLKSRECEICSVDCGVMTDRMWDAVGMVCDMCADDIDMGRDKE